ncbi:MAG: hypothetical protein OQK75_11465 [Gammaproteobacteria bacterium]|nr:hypothetical protein [Gammaproteobacteria bacterium]MCW8988272.1 hypothetical protein [Gammaproteobacteria bacterium]
MKFVPVIFLTLISFNFSSAFAEQSIKLKTPPAELENWYKPANKRQVWLHTMFRLRREMQAIEEYAQENNKDALKKWITRLDKDYNKIADMIPEWEKEIKLRLIPELEMFAEKGDSIRVAKTLKMISRTCNDCHKSYQPVVTALYRSPSYDDIKIKNLEGTPHSFKDNMDELSKSVNRILIALDDKNKQAALLSRSNLQKQLDNLGNSCTSCHKEDAYPRERILGKLTIDKLKTLETTISHGRIKESQELMGKLAVTVCARCHNTHRIVSDLRNTLMPAK